MRISWPGAYRNRRFWTAVGFALFAIGCRETLHPPEPEAIQLPLVNRIVFQSNRLDSLSDIWLMSGEGADLVRLTDSATRDRCASLSPDGNWLAFHQLSRPLAGTVAFPPLQDSLVLMRADRTNRIALVQLERYAAYGTAFCPQWSAGSDRILTASATEESRVRSNQNYRTRVLDRAGNVLATYNFGDLGVTLRAVSLSPDGARMLGGVANNSTSGAPTGYRVYSVRIDGTDRQLVGEGADGVWSPTGNAIAWNCFGVCTSSPAGANVKKLYAEASAAFPLSNSISFSPDGAYVAYGCSLSGSTRRSLCISDLATDLVEEISVGSAVRRVSWMADNVTVVFQCQLDNNEICAAKRGLKTFRNLTSNAADDSEPSAR